MSRTRIDIMKLIDRKRRIAFDLNQLLISEDRNTSILGPKSEENVSIGLNHSKSRSIRSKRNCVVWINSLFCNEPLTSLRSPLESLLARNEITTSKRYGTLDSSISIRLHSCYSCCFSYIVKLALPVVFFFASCHSDFGNRRRIPMQAKTDRRFLMMVYKGKVISTPRSGGHVFLTVKLER